MTTPDGAAQDFNSGSGNDGQGDNSGINPAWNDVLEVVPKELHSQITPHLRNWDNGVQNRFQQVQSEFAPFREFKEAGVDPAALRMGLQLMSAIEENPKQVYDLLAQQIGANNDQGDAEPENDPYADLPPQIQEQLKLIPQLQQQLETVVGWAANQQTNNNAAQEDAALESLMTNLKQQHGNFNEQFVLSRMLAGDSPEDAVNSWKSVVEEITTEARKPQAPKILGSGGVIPGENGIDPKKLDPKDTKNLVVQMLMNNAAQNR